MVNSIKKRILNRLLGSAASGNHVKCRALRNMKYPPEKVNVQVKGRHAKSVIKEMVTLQIRLPDLFKSRIVTVKV